VSWESTPGPTASDHPRQRGTVSHQVLGDRIFSRAPRNSLVTPVCCFGRKNTRVEVVALSKQNRGWKNRSPLKTVLATGLRCGMSIHDDLLWSFHPYPGFLPPLQGLGMEVAAIPGLRHAFRVACPGLLSPAHGTPNPTLGYCLAPLTRLRRQ
jgi:hypothetical protein